MTTMQSLIMSALIQFIKTNKNLRIIHQSNASNVGLLRCTSEYSLNTLIAIYYDFESDNATFRVKFNGNDVRTIDGREQFRIDYDKDVDTEFKQFISVLQNL